MARGPTPANDRDTLAAADDIRRSVGNLEDAKSLDIMALRPAILDVVEAFLWLAGDADIFDVRCKRRTARAGAFDDEPCRSRKIQFCPFCIDLRQFSLFRRA
jgi:hypothetical protein